MIKALLYRLVNKVPVPIDDALSPMVTSGGGGGGSSGTEYTEDAASAANPVGGALIARRRDTLTASEVSAENDNIAANATSKGELYVKHVDSVPVTDNAGSLTVDSAQLPAALAAGGGMKIEGVASGVAVPVSGTLSVTGVATAAAQTDRSQKSQITDGTVDAVLATSAPGGVTPGLVTRNIPSGTQTISGTVTANAGTGTMATSAAAAAQADGHSANIGALADADTASTLTGLLKKIKALFNGGMPAALGAQGALKVEGVASGTVIPVSGTVTANAGTGPFPVSDNSGSLTIDSGQLPAALAAGGGLKIEGVSGGVTIPVTPAGNVAHDAVDSGNPLKVGGRAVSTLASATMVAAADRTDAVHDLDGALIVRLDCPLGDVVSERVTNTDGADTACASAFAAPGAGVSLVVEQIIVYNDSTMNGFIDLKDGVAGTIRATIPLMAKGGAIIALKKPLKIAANTALAYDVSAAMTTVYLTFIGYKTKL